MKSLLTSIFLFFLLTNSAVGQATETFDIKLSPQTPAPNESVLAYIASFSIDPDTSIITWKINGSAVKTGIGERKINFTAPKSGEKLTLSAEVVSSSGIKLSQTVTVQPLSFDLIWEALDSYTPPLYRGKALPGEEGSILVTVIPPIKQNGEDYVYTWKRNNKVTGSASGYGKRTFVFSMNFLNKEDRIEVELYDKNGTVGKKSVILRPFSPLLELYETNPLSGPNYSKAISDSFSLPGQEASLIAEPYFFSPKSKTSSQLRFKWSLNGKGVQPTLGKDELTLRPDSKESGSASLQISISNAQKILQKATKSVTILFNQDQ